MRRGLLCLLIALNGASFSATAFGWSQQGHRWIAYQAVKAQPETLQPYLGERLQLGPWAKTKDKDAPALAADAASWPDLIRDQSVANLFKKYGSGVTPGPLLVYQRENTEDWHYSNRVVLAENKLVDFSGCKAQPKGRLHEIWPKLLQAYGQVTDSRDQAILLSFLLHLTADAYQPLHSVSAQIKPCQHDRGGNGFCVEPFRKHNRINSCKATLHRLWDSGFGVFSGAIPEIKPITPFEGDSFTLGAVDTALAPYLFDIYPGAAAELDSEYRRHSKKVVAALALQAVYHLHDILSRVATVPTRRAGD